MNAIDKDISLTLYWERDVRLKQIEYAAEKGYGLEVIGTSFPPLYNDPSLMTGWIDEYKTDLKDFPNSLSFHGPTADLIPHSIDDMVRSSAEIRVKKCIEAALAVGSGDVVFHSGINTIVTEPHYYDRMVDDQSSFWSGILDEFPEAHIFIENMWEPDAKLFSRIKKNCSNDRLKFCFDTGHFNIYAKCSLREWFADIGKSTARYHLSDNPGGWDSHLRLGQGTFDWKVFSDLINGMNTNPVFVFELYTLKDQENSIKWFSENVLTEK